VPDSLFPDRDTRLALEPGCDRCPALVACRNRIAWGVGPGNADLVVVGEAPGAGDPDAERWQGGNHTGMAYTTRHSGRRIRALFDRLGYEPYYTNAVKFSWEAISGRVNAAPDTLRKHYHSPTFEEDAQRRREEILGKL
jgi:uracil-DNA glycosylase